jgi:hypothetical protein
MSIDTIARALRARDRELAEQGARQREMLWLRRKLRISRPHGDNSGRFCSERCRENYDAGIPAYDPDYASKLNPRWYGFPDR